MGTDRQFAALCDVIDHSALENDSRLETNAQCAEHRDALDRDLEDCLKDFDIDSLLLTLHEQNVRDVPAVFNQPTVQKMIFETINNLAGLRQMAFPHPDDETLSFVLSHNMLSISTRFFVTTSAIRKSKSGAQLRTTS